MISDTWKKAVIEGSMILIGVLTALFVDSWREDIEFQSVVTATENNVIEEIVSNRERLEGYRAEFTTRQEQLEIWASAIDVNLGILYQVDSFPGIPNTFMNRSAWSMANNSQITEYIDHEFYDLAFELYATGEAMEDRLDIVLSVLFDVRGFNSEFTAPLVGVLKLYFNDIISNIDVQIRDHDEFISKFEIGA